MRRSVTESIRTIAVLACVVGSTPKATAEPAKDSLIIYGDGFAFSVREPAGWTGNSEKAASIGANVTFSPAGKADDPSAPLVRVRISSKEDENTRADLDYDMEEYRKRFPKVQFGDIELTHPSYPVFSKLFFMPGEWYEYVAYLNPGVGVPKVFSVSMNLQKRQATAAEVEAFRRVLGSLQFLTKNVLKR